MCGLPFEGGGRILTRNGSKVSPKMCLTTPIAVSSRAESVTGC